MELERLRAALNDYTRALHRPHACGLSAHHCLDYLLPRHGESTVRLDNWERLVDTSRERLDRARDLSRLIQDRSRSLAPLADHPLALLACEEWSPAWAERTIDEVKTLGSITRSAIEAARDLREWLRCSATVAAQTSWFLPKWLRIGAVRRHLRSARPDTRCTIK